MKTILIIKNKLLRVLATLCLLLIVNISADAQTTSNAPQSFDGSMIVRISEIEVYPEHLQEYLDYARNVGETSVKEEAGVLAMLPMTQLRDSCQVRILEIYASQEAYRSHILSPHFQRYKQGTLHMVKSLDLVDMCPMNPRAMVDVFRKMNNE